jgi:hypothetical protein
MPNDFERQYLNKSKRGLRNGLNKGKTSSFMVVFFNALCVHGAYADRRKKHKKIALCLVNFGLKSKIFSILYLHPRQGEQKNHLTLLSV